MLAKEAEVVFIFATTSWWKMRRCWKGHTGSEAGGEKRSGNIKYNIIEMTGHIASEAMRSDPWRSGARDWTISLRSHRWDITCTFTQFTRLYQYKFVWCTQSTHVLLSASYFKVTARSSVVAIGFLKFVVLLLILSSISSCRRKKESRLIKITEKSAFIVN